MTTLKPGRRLTARLAKIGTLDLDGDILVPGLLRASPSHVSCLGAHNHAAVPIGKAAITEVGEYLMADITFNDSSPGEDWWRALQHDFETPPRVQEFSFGFRVIEQEDSRLEGQRVRFLKAIRLHEVSPVVLGASIDSGMVSMAEGKSLRSDVEVKLQRTDTAIYPPLQAAIEQRVKTIMLRQLEDQLAEARAEAADWTPAERARLAALERKLAALKGTGHTTPPDDPLIRRLEQHITRWETEKRAEQRELQEMFARFQHQHLTARR
jgi:HK97 family phage prohead protease